MNSSEISILLEKIKNSPSEQIESETLEFKEYITKNNFYNNTKSIAKAISAFSNKNGGCIIIGVKDSSNIRNKEWNTQLKGCEAIDETSASQKIRKNLSPEINLEIKNHFYQEKNFIVIKINKSFDTLVSTASGSYYIRDGRESRPMRPREMEIVMKNFTTYDWSGDIIDEIIIEDSLDFDTVDRAIEEYRNIKEFSLKMKHDIFLESIGATIDGKITKGGLLFLGTKESILNHVGSFEYRVSEKTINGDLKTNEIWTGSLWEAIEKTRELFQRIIHYKTVPYDKRKYTISILDKIAFEEAFINALVHRDYMVDGMVTVDFLENIVSITNPGTFYSGINSDNIFIHPPRHRNKALSNIFMKFQFMDKAGVGRSRMTINSLKYGRGKPIFYSGNNYVKVVLESHSIKEEVYALTLLYNYGILELGIINELHEKNIVSADSIINKFKKIISPLSMKEIKDAVDKVDSIKLIKKKDAQYCIIRK